MASAQGLAKRIHAAVENAPYRETANAKVELDLMDTEISLSLTLEKFKPAPTGQN